MFANISMELLSKVTMTLMGGLGNTIRLFFLTLLFSLPLGLVISFGSMTKFSPLRIVTRTIVWIVRGTPLLLQILLFFYGPGLMFHMSTPDRFAASIVALSINYACYFSEIFRGGIQSIPVGQREAGEVLGMTRSQIFFKVTLLQVVKRVLPPMSNEFITLVKDTALVRVISVYELLWMGESFIKKGAIWPMFYTGVFYLAMNGLLTIFFGWIEKKLDYFR